MRGFSPGLVLIGLSALALSGCGGGDGESAPASGTAQPPPPGPRPAPLLGGQSRADDFRHCTGGRERIERVQLRARRSGCRRRHARVQHPEQAGLGNVQHRHGQVVRYARRQRRRHVLEHRDLRERRHSQHGAERVRYRGHHGFDGRATLSWTPPTENTDGSTLSNLAGYRIRYGTSAGSLTNTIVVENASVTTYVVEDLAPATWYFAVTAVTSSGAESNHSNVANKRI